MILSERLQDLVEELIESNNNSDSVYIPISGIDRITGSCFYDEYYVALSDFGKHGEVKLLDSIAEDCLIVLGRYDDYFYVHTVSDLIDLYLDLNNLN